MADLNKEQTKAQQELIDSQKGMSKKFKDLTTKLANVDSELGQNAANLRKNSKDTFIGMLKSKKLADVLRTQEADKFHRRIELEKIKEDRNLKATEDEGKKSTALNDKQLKQQMATFAFEEEVRKGSIDADQRALDERIAKQAIIGSAEKKDFENLQSLRQVMQEAEASGATSVRAANGQMQNITDARISLSEAELQNDTRTNKVKEIYLDEQEKINSDIAKLEQDKLNVSSSHALETQRIESVALTATELHAKNMKGIDERETEQRDKFLKVQNDIMDDNSKFTGFSDALKDLTGGVIDLGGWMDDATKFANNVTTVFTTMGDVFTKMGRGLLAFAKNPMKYLTMAWNSMKAGMVAMGKGFIKIGKSMLRAAARLAIGAAMAVMGMLATAMTALLAGISFAMPAIIVAAAVALLILGIMFLAGKFEGIGDLIMFKWGLIQESFSIAIAGLVLWKDKAVTFIGNVFQNIWLSIKSLFSAVMTGIENGINFAIQGINSFLPERFQIDEVDIGAKAMAKGVQEEKAAFAIEKEKEQAEFTAREDVLAARKASVVQQNLEGPPVKTGEEIAGKTTELKSEEEKRATTANLVATNVSDNSSNSNTTNIMNSPATTRNDDSTASRAGVNGRFTY